MQFNSYLFVLLFLPMTVGGYFVCNKINRQAGNIFLLGLSIGFYALNGIRSLILLSVSMAFNYLLSKFLLKTEGNKRLILATGIIANILFLGYFKYTDFLIGNINRLLGTEMAKVNIILPVAISFYSFQQIAWLVDSYRNETEDITGIEYALYVLYYPKILMGPICTQEELIVQFRDEKRKNLQWDNMAIGLQMFSLGMFKKVLLADTFARVVTWGFSNVSEATSGDLFITMFSYTFQIYFDFSGYTDMAIGISKMLNIDLPINFDSPYQAMSIRDFWKRWHISLTSFLTKYLYIPLGGNRKGQWRTYANILIVFIISGLWHGASWAFVLWGLFHGLLMVGERIFWEKRERLHPAVQWMTTFFVVSVLWLLFRAGDLSEGGRMLRQMFTFDDMRISGDLLEMFVLPETAFLLDHLGINHKFGATGMFLLSFFICLLLENNSRRRYRNSIWTMSVAAVLLMWSVISFGSVSIFIYNGF